MGGRAGARAGAGRRSADCARARAGEGADVRIMRSIIRNSRTLVQPAAVLLPVLQRAQVHPDQLGELALADPCRFADHAHVQRGDDGRLRAAHGLPGHVTLHFTHAFDQLIEVLLIHWRCLSLSVAKSNARSEVQRTFTQFSTCRPATRENSRSLLVTSTSFAERACAAIHRSLLPITLPFASSSARISP